MKASKTGRFSIKNWCILALGVLGIVTLVGCADTNAVTETAAHDTNTRGQLPVRSEQYLYSIFSDNYLVDYIDKDTGVHYWIFNGGTGVGMCPRYNADGTLMVSDNT